MSDTTSHTPSSSPAAKGWFKRLAQIVTGLPEPSAESQHVNSPASNRLKDALEEAIQDYCPDKTITSEERIILQKMLELGDQTASHVMIPRNEIVAIDYQVTMSELKEIIATEKHTRMPVYEESLDRLQGFIHLKDIVPALAGDEPFDLDEVLRDIYFISPTMKLIDLLVHMRLSGHHMAIVVDEYGGTDGLVTLEDIFEALVGEIQDEHDVAETERLYRSISSNQFDIYTRMRVDDLEEAIGLNLQEVLEDEDYDTVGGFLFASLQRVPVTGEIIDIPEIGHMKITDADPRRIHRVTLTLNFTPLLKQHVS